MSGLRETVREQGDDPLDPAIARRRHREPHRGDERDPHAGSIVTRPSWRCTSHALSKARTPREAKRARPGRDVLGRGRAEQMAPRGRARARAGAASRSTGAPAAQACGRAAVGYGMGKGVSVREKPGEDLGKLVVEVRRGVQQAPDDALSLGPAPVAREAPGDQGVVVRPDRAVVVRERVVAGVAWRTSSGRPSPTTAPPPSAGRRSRRHAPAGRSRSRAGGRCWR